METVHDNGFDNVRPLDGCVVGASFLHNPFFSIIKIDKPFFYYKDSIFSII